MTIKSLYVAGKFDDNGGKPSKIAKSVFDAIGPANSGSYNGGSFSELENILRQAEDAQLIYWFADVPNDKVKLVKEIKQRNKACVLVTSKRNTEGKYAFEDLIYRALDIKSNLLVEFTKPGNRYMGRVIDPLGNVFLDHNEDFTLVGKVLRKRVDELMSFTRISSDNAGSAVEIPDEKEFFKTVKEYAGVFHNLVHAHSDAANRFFGNASFRCERGFPSYRSGSLIFVSRRNVDKRFIDKGAFVGVKAEIPIRYFGDIKPSVDTPIQIKLYNFYPKVKFMLHSHVYVNDAPFTERVLPCGAVEEADEIARVFPDRNSVNFSVNLKGHGSLVLADATMHIKDVSYIPRGTPEVHKEYSEMF